MSLSVPACPRAVEPKMRMLYAPKRLAGVRLVVYCFVVRCVSCFWKEGVGTNLPESSVVPFCVGRLVHGAVLLW